MPVGPPARSPPVWCDYARSAARPRRRGAAPGWPIVAHLEPWEPVTDVNWEVRHAVSSWPAVCSGVGAPRARKGRMLPYVIEVDGQFCGQLTIGNVTHGALRSAWIGYWVASSSTGGGVATAALALGLDHCFGPVRAAPRRGDGAPRERGEPGGAGKGRLSRGRAVCDAISKWTAPGAITCWWPSLSRSSTVGGVLAGARGLRELGVT